MESIGGFFFNGTGTQDQIGPKLGLLERQEECKKFMIFERIFLYNFRKNLSRWTVPLSERFIEQEALLLLGR